MTLEIEKQAQQTEEPPSEEPPSNLKSRAQKALVRTPRPALWADVPDEKWDISIILEQI